MENRRLLETVFFGKVKSATVHELPERVALHGMTAGGVEENTVSALAGEDVHAALGFEKGVQLENEEWFTQEMTDSRTRQAANELANVMLNWVMG